MTNYVNIEYREQLGQFLNDHGLVGTGAEIGVAFGGYSEIVLKTWKGKTYLMVDPWCRQPKDIYREDTSGIDPEAQYAQCQELAKYDPRIRILRMYSEDAAKTVPDGELDWVFIDGNHSYEAVSKDLIAWWPKVHSGGVFAGHDYGNDTNFPAHVEVKRALDEWAIANKQTFVYSRCNSWWILKP